VNGQPPTPPSTFDVRNAGGSFYRRRRIPLYEILAVEIVLAGVGIWLGVRIYATVPVQGFGSTDSEVLVFFLVFILALLAFLAISTSRFFSGATEVEVSDGGVILRYRRGRVDRFDWTDPRHQILLYDYSAHPRMVRDDRAYSLIVPWGRLSMLTQDCFQGILVKARERGAQISTYEGSAAWYGFAPVIHKIRWVRSSRGD
jgi:hypothetical protein